MNVRGKPITSMMNSIANANGELRSAAADNGQSGELKSSAGSECLALEELTQA